MGTSHHLLHPRNWPKPSNLLKCGKAQGLDNIPPKFLKHLGHNCLSWLREFYSSSLNRVTIPTIWRKATVITVAKPNKPMDDPRSCRPISLLCVPHKLLERLILFRFEPVVGHQLPTQHDGFRSGRCTVQQVVKLTSDIEESYMRDDISRVWFSWILVRPLTLSGIRAWHWSYSRPSLIDTWSASSSTLFQTAASSLKLAMDNAAASADWRTECPKGQRSHLCFLTSISTTSPTPCLWVSEPFSEWEGTSARQKTTEKFCDLNWQL